MPCIIRRLFVEISMHMARGTTLACHYLWLRANLIINKAPHIFCPYSSTFPVLHVHCCINYEPLGRIGRDKLCQLAVGIFIVDNKGEDKVVTVL